jgi:hypothetical protein
MNEGEKQSHMRTHEKGTVQCVGAWAILAVLLLNCAAIAQTVKRCRNEGTLGCAASNVMGGSNITAFARTVSGTGADGFYLSPIVGGKIGVADILQMNVQTIIPLNAISLGSSEAHLQLTTPFNDRLRLIGIALSADLYLSTTIDTLSLTASEDKPLYNPYMLASLITDLDWISLWKNLPLKTYITLGMADNPDVLYRYEQVAVNCGFEWKMYQHSAFFDAGLGLYKEKGHRLNRNVADATYAQRYVWIEPGGRYRLLHRFSLMAAIRFPMYEKLKRENPIVPEPIRVSVHMEVPIFFRETNTEAIRTLVFMEKKKKEKRRSQKMAGVSRESDVVSKLNTAFEDLDSGGVSFDNNKQTEELKKKREEIQGKMDAIEKLFEEIE